MCDLIKKKAYVKFFLGLFKAEKCLKIFIRMFIISNFHLMSGKTMPVVILTSSHLPSISSEHAKEFSNYMNYNCFYQTPCE